MNFLPGTLRGVIDVIPYLDEAGKLYLCDQEMNRVSCRRTAKRGCTVGRLVRYHCPCFQFPGDKHDIIDANGKPKYDVMLASERAGRSSSGKYAC